MCLDDFDCVLNGDVLKYLDFYSLVRNNMRFPSWLGEFSFSDINDVINHGGVLFTFYDGPVIACSCFYIPASRAVLAKHNISYDASLVGSCGPILVNPSYVGNGLQRQMLEFLSDYCRSIGKRYIFTKVHPDNVYSINNFLSDGYVFVHQYNSSHNGLRNVYIKEVN